METERTTKDFYVKSLADDLGEIEGLLPAVAVRIAELEYTEGLMAALDYAAQATLGMPPGEWLNGQFIFDVADSYVEPGYDQKQIVLIGDWVDTSGPFLDVVEKLDGGYGWYDQWAACRACNRAFRTVANSWHWKPHGALTGDGWYCGACLCDYTPDELTDLWSGINGEGLPVNNPSSAITWMTPRQMKDAGWKEWEPADGEREGGGGREGNREGQEDDGRYQTGWHPGQDDNPADVYAQIRQQYNPAECPTDIDPDIKPRVVFLIDSTSQFYMGWSAWVWAADLKDRIGEVKRAREVKR